MSILIKGMEMPKNCCQCPVNIVRRKEEITDAEALLILALVQKLFKEEGE